MIDKDEAIRLLRKEVANKGENFIYQPPNPELTNSCYYFWKGQPSCIVGHALYDADEKYLESIDERGFSAKALSGMYSEITQDAADIFQDAQSKQDVGSSWGEALEAAEAVYRQLGGTE